MEIPAILITFFERYEWWQIGAALLGVLYILDKYFGISPVDKLIDRNKKYTFKEFNHLHKPELQNLIKKFNQKRFQEVASDLMMMKGSKRSYAFESLGQYGNVKLTEQWITEDDSAEIPKIIKSYQLIHKAWEIRGKGSIDTVTEKNLSLFKEKLREAGKILSSLKSKEFQSNIVAKLLTIYKASNTDRDNIRACFSEAEKTNKNDVELNLAYFSAISWKWGGSQEELNTYFESLRDRSNFLQILIHAQYYFDLVVMNGDEDADGSIEAFATEVSGMRFDENEWYQYNLYQTMYWLTSNLGLEKLEKHFKKLARPYFQD